MQAVLMTATGGPEVLQFHALPQPPQPSGRELQVQIRAAGVNPIDTKLRQRGTFFPGQMPAILGCDGAGIVVAVGDAVQKFRVGDAVYFCQGGLGAAPGTYAEYTTVDERFVAPMPRCLSFAEAAAAPLVVITAWEALCDRGRLQSGQRVLIHAGAGGVGHVAIQLAKLHGAEVITTVSTPEKAAFVRSLGADQVILYPETDFVRAVLAWTDGQGVDLAFDTVGGPLLAQTFPAVKLYGDVVTLLEPDAATSWKVARARNQRVSLELMLTPMLQGWEPGQQAQAEILARCGEWFDRGQLRVQVSHTFPLAAAAAAHTHLAAGAMTGKIVLVMDVA
jgi:NADPH:quinone reductase